MNKRDFYVYVWKNSLTGKVFYVGKGRKSRYKNVTGRNKLFKDYFNTHCCHVEKIYEGLREQDAFYLEIQTIAEYKELGQAKCNLTKGGEGHSGGGEEVVQIKICNCEVVGTYLSATEASYATGICRNNISACCTGNVRTAGGYYWRHASDKVFKPFKKKPKKEEPRLTTEEMMEALRPYAEWCNRDYN
jgi:hypothetical protein